LAYRILSFDGGGSRGLLTAVLVRRLVAEIPELVASTQLLAGTSTGSLIALSLALGREPAQIVDDYQTHLPLIFADNLRDNLRDLWGLVGAQYDGRALERLCFSVAGERRLRDLDTPVLVPAFQLDNRAEGALRSWKAKFYYSGADGDERVADVALRSCAAPILFPSYQGHIDGGVVAANPAMAAVALALDPRVADAPLADIRVLSLGTGTVTRYVDAGESGRLDWGVVQWGRPLVNILIEGVMGVADYQVRQLLGERYFRLSPPLPREISHFGLRGLGELARVAEAAELDATVRWIREQYLA
jgi:patatin-like phospholipase/acyl hydrolase